jgi:MoaA/NifB/PqqE/SkfB family radical SAM enzyme
VTRRCNLKCRYCFVRRPDDKELNEKGIIRVIDKLYDFGIRVLNFSGGEPTLRNDLVRLIRYASGRRMMVYLSTNGTLLTEAYISSLLNAGLSGIIVSVDSVMSNGQQLKRYEDRKELLHHLMAAKKAFGLEIIVGTFLTTKNVEDIGNIISVFHDLKLTLSIGIINDNTFSNNGIDRSLFFSSSEDKQKLFGRLEQIKKLKNKGYSIFEPLRYFDDMARFVNGDLTDWNCPAGTTMLTVNCDGRLQLCSSLPPEDYSIFELEEFPRRELQLMRKRRFEKCKKLCLANCQYTTSFVTEHPLKFLKEAIFRPWSM